MQRAHRAGIPYKGIAVLYRTNAQSRKLEDSFLYGRVPYRIYAGMSFYQREEIKDMLSYLRLSVNPSDEEALRRVINKPARGIGDTTVKKLFAIAAEAGTTVWEALGTLSNSSLKGEKAGEFSSKEALPLREGLGGSHGFNAGTLKRLTDFRDMIASFHDSVAADDAYTLALRVVKESGLQDHIFSGHEPEDVSRQENLQEMIDGIAAFVQDNREQGRGVLLADYLQEASLATDLDRSKTDQDADTVSLMTIHSAKGLEFPVVFIAGLEEGLFPSEMTSESPRALEEERRLFYVALTRAERQVIITYAKSRFRNGKMEYSSPSRFIREIPQEYYKGQGARGKEQENSGRSPVQPGLQSGRNGYRDLQSQQLANRISNAPNQIGRIADPTGQAEKLSASLLTMEGLKVGSVVLHDRFGQGVVQSIEGSGIDAKATVRFDNAGTKVLMLRFARLTVKE